MDELREIPELGKLKLEPGELLVIKIKNITPNLATALVEQLSKQIPTIKNKVWVIDKDIDIGAITPPGGEKCDHTIGITIKDRDYCQSLVNMSEKEDIILEFERFDYCPKCGVLLWQE